MMYKRTVKGEQFLDTKDRGRRPSAMAKTKHCHSLFPVANIFVSKKHMRIGKEREGLEKEEREGDE